MTDEPLRLRVRMCMDHRFVWELSTPDGHVIETSGQFSDRDACIADAARHKLPISGVRKPRRTPFDGNILANLPQIYIAQALQCLPDAEVVSLDTMDALSEVPRIGLVRITAKRTRMGSRDKPKFAWIATKAVACDG